MSRILKENVSANIVKSLKESYPDSVSNLSQEEKEEIRNNSLYKSIVSSIDANIYDEDPKLAIKILDMLKGDLDVFRKSLGGN